MKHMGWMVACLVVACAGLQQARADDPWVSYPTGDGPGKGKKIVFVTGDDEYRSEESMPMLAKILARRQGFDTTVLFAIDPKTGAIDPSVQNNIPGLEKLDDADLMVIFTRFRDLPPEQMDHIVKYTNSGKPIIGIRTATHAFNFEKPGPYSKWTWNNADGGWGRMVLGETWVSHYGNHMQESTRGTIVPERKNEPIVRGVGDIWVETDVYGIKSLSGDSRPLVMGQPLIGMNPTDPPQTKKPPLPVAWTKTYTGTEGKAARVFATTMGGPNDFKDENLRRLLVNACYWGLRMEHEIPERNNVELVGEYNPTRLGFNHYKRGVKPADFKLSG